MNNAEIEKFCMDLKGTQQDIKWGNDLCYTVGKKMYCVTSLKGEASVSFKTTPEKFNELIERAGIIPAPYVAKYHWVMVENFKALSVKEWKMYIKDSYEMVFDKLPKKLKESIIKK